MRDWVRFAAAGLLGLGLCGARSDGQATSTASAPLQFSAFGGVSGVYTGVGGGRNLSITAGADMTIRSFFGLHPSAEVRGTYPVKDGAVDSQKNILGGVTISKFLGNFQPYADLLGGRGQINFSPPLLDSKGQLYYVQSSSFVFSPGAGANFLFGPRLGLKADFQFLRYLTPATASGSVYSKALTLGVVYRLNASGVGRLRHY